MIFRRNSLAQEMPILPFNTGFHVLVHAKAYIFDSAAF